MRTLLFFCTASAIVGCCVQSGLLRVKTHENETEKCLKFRHAISSSKSTISLSEKPAVYFCEVEDIFNGEAEVDGVSDETNGFGIVQ